MSGAAYQGAVDLQVNGYAGIDFNSDGVTPEDYRNACAALRKDGAEAILATVITDDLDAMCRRLGAIVAAREADDLARDVICGIHIEGPFLNPGPGFIGAHPADAAMPADAGAMRRLIDAAGGLTRVVTLAPEQDPGLRTTAFLARQGIIVSAGHCDPDLDTLRAAIDAGLSMFTHLGNGCPMQLHRHDNVIQRVLSLAGQLDIGFIADGVHVPAPALRNYLQLAGAERSFFVTDAISAARLGPGLYKLGRWEIKIGDDLVARSPDGSHFIGSTATVPRLREFALRQLGLAGADFDRLMCDNPRRILGLGNGS